MELIWSLGFMLTLCARAGAPRNPQEGLCQGSAGRAWRTTLQRALGCSSHGGSFGRKVRPADRLGALQPGSCPATCPVNLSAPEIFLESSVSFNVVACEHFTQKLGSAWGPGGCAANG